MNAVSNHKRRTLVSVDAEALEHVSGGYKTRGRRQSYNVEDRRPGAPSRMRQRWDTFVHNWNAGYWY